MRKTCAAVLMLALTSGSLAQEPEIQPLPDSLSLEISDLPRTLDPHRAGDSLSMRQAAHAYEAPLEYNPFESGKLRPCLLASMPEVSADGLTWTLRLREDVRFANHEALAGGKARKATAADLAFSWKRLAALPDSASYWLLEGRIDGLDEFARSAPQPVAGKLPDSWWKHLDKAVSGLVVSDEHTLRLKLTEPRTDFMYILAFPALAVIAREAAREGNLDVTPAGTGPYVLKERGPTGLVWSRNSDYRLVKLSGVPATSPLKALEGRALPLTGTLTYTVLPEESDSTSALEAGRIHAAPMYAASAFDLKALAAGNSPAAALAPRWKDKGFGVVRETGALLSYLSFNMNDAQLGTPAGARGLALRRALALSLDRGRMASEVRGHNAVPANCLTMPGIAGHPDGAAMASQRHDPAEGRRILEQAGFKLVKAGDAWKATGEEGNQVEVRLTLRSKSDSMKREGEFISACWAQVGVKANVEAMTFPEFLKAQDEGTGQVYSAGWVYDIPDAANILQLLFGGPSPFGLNSSGFSDKQFDTHFRTLEQTPEDGSTGSARRLAAVEAMYKILDEHCPWTVCTWSVYTTVVAKGVFFPGTNGFSYDAVKFAAWIPQGG